MNDQWVLRDVVERDIRREGFWGIWDRLSCGHLERNQAHDQPQRRRCASCTIENNRAQLAIEFPETREDSAP